MDTFQEAPQDAPRKGPQLPPLQTAFDNQAYRQLHRPRPPVFLPANPSDETPREEPYGVRENHASVVPERQTANSMNIRRSSRFGLAGLFSRSKPLNTEEKSQKLGTHLEVEGILEKPVENGIDNAYVHGPQCFPEEIDALPIVEDDTTSLRHRTSKTALKIKAPSQKDINVKPTASWDPPPLFQVYPQAIKHATLRAPSLPAEAIVRLKSSPSIGSSTTSDSYTPDLNIPKAQKGKKPKRDSAASVLGRTDWTHKVFVLVTSGYFLQYAGDGAFDRYPEKIMPLTTESAAFASDAIPGQPYVLQISQVSDDQGTLDKNASKSRLKKLGLRSEMRRSTSTFLLVLESPEEMSAWLVAVRKEIQNMGGREFRLDDIKETEENIPQLQQKPSQRYLIKRDPNRFNNDKSPRSPPDAASTDYFKPSTTSNRQSLATQSSTGSRSVSNTGASINQIHLDQLRESPRESYASTDAKTVSTSPESSPRLSPVRDEVQSGVPDPSFDPIESPILPSMYRDAKYISLQMPPNANVSRRKSRQPKPSTSPPQQTSYFPPQHRRPPSPSAPNFSVPSFSKRYLTANYSSSTTIKAQTPPITLNERVSPPIIDEEEGIEQREIGELRHLRAPNTTLTRPAPQTRTDTFLTPPNSSGSINRPLSSERERKFSRRQSSLDYARGISPVGVKNSPSPHPPPTAALPALPEARSLHRASLIPPPTTALPPIPTAGKLSQRSSMIPPPSSAPSKPHKNELNNAPLQGFQPGQSHTIGTVSDQDLLPTPQADYSAFYAEGLTPLSDPSPPKPTREPPPPPTPVQQSQGQRPIPRTGREPPPLYSPATSPRPRISFSSCAESYFDGAAPHPFIPPIRVSERKFRGRPSLDGPWNPGYGAPQRTFMDLSVN